MGKFWLLANYMVQLVAIHLWHHDVADNYVDALLIENADSLLAVGRAIDLVPRGTEQALQDIYYEGIVINDKYRSSLRSQLNH